MLEGARRHGGASAGRGRQSICRHAARPGSARGVNELHVEAGHRLNGALVRAGLVDELLYLAPKLLGPGGAWPIWGRWNPGAGAGAGIQGVDRVGPDLRVLARVMGRDAF